MSLAPFDTFCAEDSDRFEVRRWLLPAIVLSVGFHVALVIAFQFKRVESFPIVQTAPRQHVMVLWRLNDPPEFPAEDEGKVIPNLAPAAILPIPTPLDRPIPGDPLGSPLSPLTGPSLPLAAKATAAEEANAHAQSGVAPIAAAVARWNSITEGLLARRVEGPGLPVAKGPIDPEMSSGSRGTLSIAGRRTLDEALARMEPVAVGDAPIDIAGGALFDYNHYALRSEAMEQLRKLGKLIQRNPDSVFSIEGHTDSIGSPEYNQVLSERRAVAVKEWLVQYIGISPARVETRGFGSTRLLVPATGTVEEQQPNRRVEIVIKAR